MPGTVPATGSGGPASAEPGGAAARRIRIGTGGMLLRQDIERAHDHRKLHRLVAAIANSLGPKPKEPNRPSVHYLLWAILI